MIKLKRGESGFTDTHSLLILCVIVIIGFVGWYVWYNKNSTKPSASVPSVRTESQIKEQLTAVVNKLPVPAKCQETSRMYTPYETLGDTIANWHIEYSCNDVTNEDIHTEVTIYLKAHNYSLKKDYSLEGPGYFYDFSYIVDGATVDYKLVNGSDMSVTKSVSKEEKPELAKAMVSKVLLEVRD